jgi:hypothetical protein
VAFEGEWALRTAVIGAIIDMRKNVKLHFTFVGIKLLAVISTVCVFLAFYLHN